MPEGKQPRRVKIFHYEFGTWFGLKGFKFYDAEDKMFF